MQVFGLDFTSAPRVRKPLTCAGGVLDGTRLHIDAVVEWTDFAGFEDWLSSPGAWVAALDFPFGQPRKLLVNLGWEPEWAAYVARFGRLDVLGFEALLRDYRSGRPAGDKEHARATDRLAGSRSPMKVANPPVGKMFLQGAPRLLRASVSVLPVRPTQDERIVLEGYPALVARKWLGRQSYKSDTRSKQTAALGAARATLLEAVCSAALSEHYGITLEMPDALRRRCVDDASGDTLDAVLCAIQAAWAVLQPGATYGLPTQVDAAEGWIIDPALLGAV